MELKQRTKTRKEKNSKGITLIALVIAIIILLILAGVSIAMLTGENGILSQAAKAKEETEKAQANEAAILDEYNKYLNNAIGGTAGGEVEGPQPTPEPEPGGSLETTDNGVIEIKWLKDDTYNVSETANAPVIKSDLPANTTMKLVKYDGSNWIEGTDYDYKAGSGIADNTESKWANAEVTIDNVKSYFVWIPRYAYRIIYFDTAENKEAYLTNGNTEGIIGYSDSRGIVDKDGKKVDGVASTTSINVRDYFRVHPAFMNDSRNDYSNGGWNEELPGIWVGKYESSLVNKADSSNIDTSSSTIGDIIVDSTNNTDKAIAVQAGMSSWRYCTIRNQYTNAKAYSTNLNSHMLKNSEWGAVAYLTESKYGRNGTEVDMNNKNYITAMGDIVANKLQSTTGNETGIYDLRGGAAERVAAYYTGGNQTYLNNGISLVNDYANESTKKYVNAYAGTNVSTDYKPGDATYETKNWHSDAAIFVDSSNPFFSRGSYYSNFASSSGEFFYGNSNGDSYSSSGFRMCLAVK